MRNTYQRTTSWNALEAWSLGKIHESAEKAVLMPEDDADDGPRVIAMQH
jgi:hypothetical protein